MENWGTPLRELTIRGVFVLLLFGLSIRSGASASANDIAAGNTDVPEVAAILLLGMALLGAANLLRRYSEMRKRAVDSSLQPVSALTSKAH